MRVSEQYQKEQEAQLQNSLAYEEWLQTHYRDDHIEPTGSELNEMEKEYVSKEERLQALNNTYYYPLQGA